MKPPRKPTPSGTNYRHDEPGRILCHNVDEFGGIWLVVNSRGDAVS